MSKRKLWSKGLWFHPRLGGFTSASNFVVFHVPFGSVPLELTEIPARGGHGWNL